MSSPPRPVGGGAIRTWATVDTEYSACSVETHGSGLVATGTYQVNKLDEGEAERESEGDGAKTQRLGRLLLHRVVKDDDGGLRVEEVARRECPAILDMAWSPSGELQLGVCDASGSVTLYQAGEAGLEQDADCEVSSGLVLAVDWGEQGLVASDSRGEVHVLRRGEGGLVLERSLEGHQYEAWTVCWDRHQSNLLFSGGDDCAMVVHDLREGMPVRRNKGSHSMGVTTLLSSATKEHCLWSGSYDERLRTWDLRNLKSEVSAVSVGGGVWRIRQRGERLLVAAMHDGFKVVEGGEVVAEYREHESLAYGADWLEGQEVEVEGRESISIATCSFYDHMLKVWSVAL